jgi:hypothetical protein
MQRGSRRTPELSRQVDVLGQALTRVMRGFGRRCRGQGKVFVPFVRQTEQPLLALGDTLDTLGHQAQERLAQATTLREPPRERLTQELTVAMRHHGHIRQQSQQLTQGKKRRHCKLVHAFDLTMAPIMKGKRHCPAQFGRKPGIISEPATGFLFAHLTPKGHPRDASSVRPLLDQVQAAPTRTQHARKHPLHSVAGELGLNDPVLRQDLHARGLLTVGLPKTIEPMHPNPSAQEILDRLNEAGLHRTRTPFQVHLACASGYSRPVVESQIAR